jgi:hypothetical protein
MSRSSKRVTRRRFLKSLSVSVTSAGLSGCRIKYPVLAAGALAPAQKAAAMGPLTIDTHCHIFNGTDIQLKMFLEKIQKNLPPRLVELAGKLELKAGITGHDEWEELVKLAQRSKCAIVGTTTPANGEVEDAAVPLSPESTQPRKSRDHIRQMKENAFSNTKTGISRAIRQNPPKDDDKRTKDTDTEVNDMLTAEDHQSFSNKAEAYKSKFKRAAGGNACGDGSSLGADLETVVDYYLPRIVLAQLYLDTFCPPAERNVDLMFCPMVDFDWWLAKGSNAETPLQQQVKLMEQISILSRGRIHGFAPFCPLREVAYRAGYGDAKTGWSSLDFVKDAVLNRGCIGVKLYPPMGFAPYGNAELDDPNSSPWNRDELKKCEPPVVSPHPEFWSRNHLLPDWVCSKKMIRYPKDGSEERLGIRLDGALACLYEWCQDEGVPILAHSNASNGIDCIYQELASAGYWRKALTKYPKLRVSFGHLGDFDEKLDSNIRVPISSQAFIDLMGNYQDPADDTKSKYVHAYADSAFDAVLLSCGGQFATRLKLAYEQPVFAERFLYGTDWSLMVHVGHNKLYLKDYEALMVSADTRYRDADRKPSERFFGWNAVDYAGLRAGDKSRQRLNDFYAKYNVEQPGWVAKVDAG